MGVHLGGGGSPFAGSLPKILGIDQDFLWACALCHDVGRPFEFNPTNHARWGKDAGAVGVPSTRNAACGVRVLLFEPAPTGGRIRLTRVDVPDHDHQGVEQGYYWTPRRASLEHKWDAERQIALPPLLPSAQGEGG
jgi:cytochrome c peroxidase